VRWEERYHKFSTSGLDVGKVGWRKLPPMRRIRHSAFLAGSAAIDVTPALPVQLSGFGARTGDATGVHDPLYARAVAVATPGTDPTVLIAVDCLGIDATLAHAVRVGLAPLAPERIAVVATHTHGGPPVLRNAHLGQVEDRVVERIVAGAVEAANSALAALAPAEMRFGRSDARGIARNRRQPGGAVDDEVAVTSLWRAGATAPFCVLVDFAMHPVVLGSDNRRLTRDYVGYLVDGIEAQYPGCLGMFVCGCAGQINMGHLATDSWTTAPTQTRTFDVASRIGERLVAAVREAVELRSLPVSPVTGVRAVRHELSLPMSRPARPVAEALQQWKADRADALSAGDDARVGLVTGLVDWATARLALPSESEQAGNHRTVVQAFSWGDASIVFLPGEPFVEYGLTLKQRHGPRLIVCAYANDAPGYIPTAAAVVEGGYEVDAAYMYYGLAGPFPAITETLLLGACETLLAALEADTLDG
jgi:hypothetical protein